MDQTAYRAHFDLDHRHFWRIAKRRLILDWFRRYVPGGDERRLLDVGGACSLISAELARLAQTVVVEPEAEMVETARREMGLDIRQGALPDALPVEGPFDVVTLLDVLEHVDEDAASLEAVRDLLRPGGTLVCTVPALQWLWSSHDEVLHHKRRYDLKGLRDLLEQSGFRVRRISYYSCFLLPVLALQRLAGRLRPRTGPPAYRVHVPNVVLNTVFGWAMSAERLALRYVNLPIGWTLIAICEKPKDAS
jgi:SAM-dependent methyltransferase